jgi:preprotein translocase subunit SecA
MFEHAQDRVTDLVFKAKMQIQLPQQQAAQQEKGQAQQQQQAQQKTQQLPARPKAAEQSVRAAAEAVTKQGGAGGTMTVGRNEPCPCGSGIKYKKCCGKK